MPQTRATSARDALKAALFEDYEAPKPSTTTCDYQLTHASQGQEAFERVKAALAEDNPYSIAFVDMRMPPGWDGVETITRLWSLDPRIEVVICTAYSDYSWREIADRLDDSGQYVVLKKPFESIEIRQLARSLTEKWSYARAAEDRIEYAEEVVRRRTLELEASNRALKLEIEERQRAEAALVKSERLAAIGSFAGGVAHEFNNINTVILGYLEFIQADEALSPQLQEDLSHILSFAQRANAITKRMLLLTRRSKPGEANLKLSEIAQGVLDLVREEYALDGVTLTLERASDVEGMATKELGQVILNLLINARRALIDRPERSIRVETGVAEARAYVKVEDTGCGIPEGELGSIFTPFYSIKGAPQGEVKGAGLGLSICERIILDNAGSIEVESQEGVGSTFTVWLPLLEGEATEARPIAAPDRPAARSRILVVDDELHIRRFICKALTREGHSVETAGSFKEACACLDKEPFDLVITDLQMPGVDGSSLVVAIDEDRFPSHPSVIMLTGSILSTAMADELAYRDCDVLEKPISVDDLILHVSSALPKA